MGYVMIPLDNSPDQTFTVTIPVDGVNKAFLIRLRYNLIAKYWVMSVSDQNTGGMILDGVPLVTGQYPAADLFRQYAYLGLGSAAIVPTGEFLDRDYPDDADGGLGGDFVLVWGDTV
jgi:hypothetical protein